MPTIPLYTPPPIGATGAWHRVTAPGGYEWWSFRAMAEGRCMLIADFYQGFFCSEYVRRYRRYLHRPARHRPPLPVEYPVVRLVLAPSENPLVEDRGDFAASDTRLDVKIGQYSAVSEGDRYRLTLDGDSISFRPQSPIHACDTPCAEHHWIAASVLCHVEGRFRGVELATGGLFEHRFGTRPLWELPPPLHGK